MSRPRKSVARVFAMPLLVGLASIAGLVLGLTGEGWRDFAAWLLVGLAPLVLVAMLLRRPSNLPRI